MSNKRMMLTVADKDRHFTVEPHALVFEDKGRHTKQLVFASYIGIPEAVQAVTAAFLEERSLHYGPFEFERMLDPYKRLERLIGLGDVAHGAVYNSLMTLEGIEASPESEKLDRAYLMAPEGDIDRVLSEHLVERFGLPREWMDQYPSLFRADILPLQIIVNPDLPQWNELKAVMFSGTEQSVIETIRGALKRKELVIPPSTVQGEFDPTWTMKDYLLNNAVHMAKKLEEKAPRHSMDKQVDPSIAELKRIPFPTQAHMIQGVVNTLEDENPACGGDMGTGKSIIACGVSHVLHERKKRKGSKRGTAVLLSAPGITLPKWEAKEIKGTIPGAKVTILRNGNDALKLLRNVRSGYRPSGLEFTLVGIDRAKLGAEGYFAGIWKRISGTKEDGRGRYAWHCPDCFKPLLTKMEGADDYEPATWFDAADSSGPTLEQLEEARETKTLQANGLPAGFKVAWKRKNRIECCNVHLEQNEKGDEQELPQKSCNAMLWRPALKSRGETKNKPRVNISQVLKRTKRYFDLYICDEAHQCKAGDSGRGDAFAQMVKSAKRVLMLTGTLTNGKSTSIKELLWRTDPKSLLDAGFTHQSGLIEWASRFGKLEKVVEVEEGDEGVITRRKKKGAQVKEAPGIAPQLTAQFLLHKSGFVELKDLGLPLVELKEIPVFLDMDDEHRASYQRFHNNLYERCAQISRSSKSVGAWSKFSPSTINYGDRPDLGAHVVLGQEGEIIGAPALYSEGKELHAKERWLVETVRQELAENRRCTIFNNFTGAYGMNERIRNILTDHGIQCKILDEPNTDLRQERLAELEAEEVPVIICNMKLVEVGLDMLYWPTIIVYQLNNEVSTVRQATRRAWRIGQDRECRVYYPVYNGSQQMKQFIHIMNGRGHALMVEGRLDSSELAQYSRDSQSSLASDLASCFASSDVAQSWTALAAKDLADIEMVEEGSFKEVLAERMRALADETLKICGVVDLAAYRAEKERLERESIATEPEIAFEVDMVEDEVRTPSVFDFDFQSFGIEQAFPGAEVPIEEDPAGTVEPEIVVSMTKYKKARGRKAPAENQLCWNF
ncbi:DEAD/DEAH box helicase [Cohnella sp. AR92]|uniref:helicase-related protein n=1 Tax=Cohnella sp. AR92 TaxID=648716 RepID=UPI000F8DA245|nr:DEAD/DEAH box helicase [Cohnella sp. AR92]RUS44920.1 DEAD/DEAH box helicase [Cohnella sp. AR92]